MTLRKRRAGLIGGVAVGAFVLAPAAAHAANFEVNSLNDPGDGTCDVTECTLREAITASNASGTDDTITFQSGLTGTIALTAGPLVVDKGNDDYSTTITGPGEDDIYVSGEGASLVFDVAETGGDTGLTISGLTIGDGYGDVAGGLYAEAGTYVTLADSTVTGNTGIGFAGDKYYMGGGGITNRGSMTIENSTISDNYSNDQIVNGPPVGGGGVDNLGDMSISGSTIYDNGSSELGGGILDGISKYPTSLDISNTTISDNGAPYGGGIATFNLPGSVSRGNHHVTNSTITGNFAETGAGAAFKYIGGNSRWTISHSTVSENHAYQGGGLSFGLVPGSFNLVDSTISGNQAEDVGGGAYIVSLAAKYADSMNINNSTIASNDAGSDGGGLFLNDSSGSDQYDLYATPLFSTIVGDNTADGGPNDLAQGTGGGPAATGGGFDLSFSLVEAPGSATISQTPAGSNLLGVDPQLGGLAGNGGPTQTQLPATGSPVVDKGSAPGNLTTDQRGDPRTLGGGTDIGSVELPAGPPPPPPPPPPPAAGGTKVGTLKKKHKKRRRVIRTKHKTAKIRITFRTSTPGVTFRCSVDGKAFAPCRSPFTTKVRAGHGKGKKHNIAIQQVDSAGNQVGKTRVFKFRVVIKD